MPRLFVELWNAIPDGLRIPNHGAGPTLLRLLGGLSCRYYEDASITC